jgi:hypothetical protein
LGPPTFRRDLEPPLRAIARSGNISSSISTSPSTVMPIFAATLSDATFSSSIRQIRRLTSKVAKPKAAIARAASVASPRPQCSFARR